jgi:HPt (histidine-containing phosphotransfer) domain-containing protein
MDEMLDRWLPATQSNPQVLDQARLVELQSAFPGEEMDRMLEDLAASIATELDQIGKAASQGDRASFAAAVHRLKNSAGMIGATRLADAAGQLDGRVATDPSSAQPYDETAVRALFDHWNETRAALQAELAQTQ